MNPRDFLAIKFIRFYASSHSLYCVYETINSTQSNFHATRIMSFSVSRSLQIVIKRKKCSQKFTLSVWLLHTSCLLIYKCLPYSFFKFKFNLNLNFCIMLFVGSVFASELHADWWWCSHHVLWGRLQPGPGPHQARP